MTLTSLPRIAADHPTGHLNLAQRWRIVLAALRARRAANRRQPAGEPAPPALSESLIASLEPPTGPLAEASWALASAAQPDWLNQHALRTWAWAQALGVIGDLSFDREPLFAACAFHDIGLAPIAATPADHCFALRGARHAARVLRPHGDAVAVGRVADAIARHIDLAVLPSDGVEAHLLHSGAAVDVMGRGLDRLPRPYRDAVLRHHPRLGMKSLLCQCLRREAAAAPGTRMGLYARRLGFVELIERAPFAE